MWYTCCLIEYTTWQSRILICVLHVFKIDTKLLLWVFVGDIKNSLIIIKNPFFTFAKNDGL